MAEVRNALDGIPDYDTFVARLASICEPNAKVFQTFEPALTKAYDLLGEYRAILKNSELTRTERKAASRESIKLLEQEGITDEFYSEFSACIKNAGELAEP